MKKTVSLILALVLMFTLFAGCGSQGQSEQGEPAGQTQPAGESEQSEQKGETAQTVTKDNLVVAVSSEPGSLAPYSHNNQQAFIPATLVYESLIVKDDNGEYQPCLATEWSFTDDVTLEVTLREGVKFHDGTDFTAEDVVYSLGLMQASSFTSNLFGCIDTENTVADGDYKVIIKLQYPFAALLEALASYRGVMISKDSYESLGEEGYGHAAIGTGPLMLDEWVSGDRLEFVQFDDYWGEPTAFHSATVRFITEAASRTIELETGGVDLAFDLQTTDWDRIANGSDTQLISGDSQKTTFLMINCSKAPYDNELVRKALAYATDVDSLVNVVYQGAASVADCWMAPSIIGYKSEEQIPYDVEKAKELLAEAGVTDLTVKFGSYENATNLAVAEVLESMWGAAGIKLELAVTDLATYTADNNAGELEVSYMNTAATIPDPTAALLVWPLSRTISLRHNDQTIQDYLDKGSQEYDSEARVAIYNELMDYFNEKYYTIPIAFEKGAFGASKSITNLPYYPSNVPDLTRIQFE